MSQAAETQARLRAVLLEHNWRAVRRQVAALEFALLLVKSRPDVVSVFRGESSLPLSEFARRLALRTPLYLSSNGVAQAAHKTGYLKVRPKGSGFRVYLIGKDQQ